MNAADPGSWTLANQQHMIRALQRIRGILRGYAGLGEEPEPPAGPENPSTENTGPFALEILAERFGLSSFEQDILVLCASIELDSRFASLCATAQQDMERQFPTFSLSLSALPGAHWSAIGPEAPLRYWRMIDVKPGRSLTTSQIRIDERILHYLTGIQYLDERLAGYARPVRTAPAHGYLVPSHQAIVGRIAGIWRARTPLERWPVIQLCGADADSRRDIACAAGDIFGLSILAIPSQGLPSGPVELEALSRLCDREAILTTGALLLECDDADLAAGAARAAAPAGLAAAIRAPLFISTREILPPVYGSSACIPVQGPGTAEQMDLWKEIMGGAGSITGPELAKIVSQFNLSSRTIRHIGGMYRSLQAPGEDRTGALPGTLWDSCREQTRSRLSDMAQHICPAATWDDLVLPELQKEILKDIAAQVRHRMQVYRTWGFAGKSSRGLGISALFAGVSGTGKTMAAEVLAHELSLDLYRIDLSQVVSKYIGETEKNLRHLFDAAEDGGAILLFDEADALFGKRSEVKDSHDRYANIEVSYLLQRMEEYRGLAILTTNIKESLDPAFLRRLRFVVRFPFPDSHHRMLIWERVFPKEMPREGIDTGKLARLNVPGGNIRNIALAAAFLAADDGGVVRMQHLLRAARAEYAKTDRPLTDSETGGWV